MASVIGCDADSSGETPQAIEAVSVGGTESHPTDRQRCESERASVQ